MKPYLFLQLLVLIIYGLGRQPEQAAASPAAQPTPTALPGLGLAGQQQCWGCTSLPARVTLSHYNPNEYNPLYPQQQCWGYSEQHKYCLSPTWIGVPWESVYGFGAACPAEWAIGTWVNVPGVGAFICMDHGGDITCKDGVCRVDILGPGGAWDQKTYDVTLLVPRSFLIRYSEKTQ